MQDIIYIRDRDAVVLEAHPEPDGLYILLRREGEAGTALGECTSTGCATWPMRFARWQQRWWWKS